MKISLLHLLKITAGDVTPKFTYNPKRHFQRGKWYGKYEDDIESAQYNGNIQYKKALAIYNNLASKSIDTTELDSGLQHVDFGNVSVNPKFTNGLKNVRTSPACMGSAFF